MDLYSFIYLAFVIENKNIKGEGGIQSIFTQELRNSEKYPIMPYFYYLYLFIQPIFWDLFNVLRWY